MDFDFRSKKGWNDNSLNRNYLPWFYVISFLSVLSKRICRRRVDVSINQYTIKEDGETLFKGVYTRHFIQFVRKEKKYGCITFTCVMNIKKRIRSRTHRFLKEIFNRFKVTRKGNFRYQVDDHWYLYRERSLYICIIIWLHHYRSWKTVYETSKYHYCVNRFTHDDCLNTGTLYIPGDSIVGTQTT